jgi:hypothetical protein
MTELLGKPLPQVQTSAAALAELFMYLDNVDAVFAWLDVAMDPLNPTVRALAVEPLWDPLRSDPRFLKLLKKLNLPAI